MEVAMETLLVVLIVAAASAYLIGRFVKTWKQKDACGCGCSGCNVEETCSEPVGSNHEL